MDCSIVNSTLNLLWYVNQEFVENCVSFYGFPGGSDGKESACSAEIQVWSLSQEDSLEKGMAVHSSILAWRIPWTEEPGGLQAMRSQRVRHDWVAERARMQSLWNVIIDGRLIPIKQNRTHWLVGPGPRLCLTVSRLEIKTGPWPERRSALAEWWPLSIWSKLWFFQWSCPDVRVGL